MTEELAAYTFEDRDEFKRRPIAENIITLVSNPSLNLSPLVIDGVWGTGKTEFCYKLVNLHRELRPDDQVAYLDAFKVDVGDQPLVALLATILELIPENRAEELKSSAMPVVKFASKVALKAASKWILKQDADEIADEFEEEFVRAAGSVIDSAVESMIEEHREHERTVEALRQVLVGIAEENPIIIYIDELDRCRPDFALSMLEAIKHVFDVDNVRFVLIANTRQLLASIKHRYGIEEQAESYLRKFVRHHLRIPSTVETAPNSTIEASQQHLKQLIDHSEILVESYLHKQVMTHLFDELVALEELSLRDVESFVLALEIYQTLTDGFPENLITAYGLLRGFGVFVANRHIENFSDVMNEVHVTEALLSILRRDHLDDPHQEDNPGQLNALAAFVALESGNADFFIDGEGDEEGACIANWRQSRASYFQGSPGGIPVRAATDTIQKVLRAMVFQHVRDA